MSVALSRADGTTVTLTTAECIGFLQKLSLSNLSELTNGSVAYIRTDPPHLLLTDLNSPQNLVLYTLYSFSHDSEQHFQLRLEHKNLGTATDYSSALQAQGYPAITALSQTFAATYHAVVPKTHVEFHDNSTNPIISQRKVYTANNISRKPAYSFNDESMIVSQRKGTGIDVGGVVVKKLNLFDLFIRKKLSDLEYYLFQTLPSLPVTCPQAGGATPTS